MTVALDTNHFTELVRRSDPEAAAAFHHLQSLRLRVGTMDLKLAAVCLAHDSILLSRNLADFAKIPGLRIENGLD